MVNRRTHRNLVWIDVESPTPNEIRPLVEEFGIHPLVADELLGPSLKPKVDFYGNVIYCILHFPALKHSHHDVNEQEIDFVIGQNFLITTHYDTVDPLHKFSKIFEVNSTLDKSNIGSHAGYLFYYMVKKLYRSLHHELENIEASLRKIEDEIFKGHERDMVVEISRLARDILTMKRPLTLHSNVLSSLRSSAKKLFSDEEFDFYLRDIEGEYTKVDHLLKGLSEFLSELRNTNNSLLTTKQNDIGRTLTVMAFVILPASLIASTFSMQVKGLPFSGEPKAFFFVIAIMGIVVLVNFLIFKRKKWL